MVAAIRRVNTTPIPRAPLLIFMNASLDPLGPPFPPSSVADSTSRLLRYRVHCSRPGRDCPGLSFRPGACTPLMLGSLAYKQQDVLVATCGVPPELAQY